jgi:hypothetical protein
MKAIRPLFLLIVLLWMVITAGNALAQVWSVIGSGGGRAESGIYALDCTIGQPLVGNANAVPFELCSGFWCGASAGIWIYLPLILR